MLKKPIKKIHTHILFNFNENISGGGKQFLKLLKNYFIKKEIYTENPDKADVIIFNSHQCIYKLINLKLKYKDKLFIHRIDGPMKLYNHPSDKRDDIVYICNKFISDGNIYQSNWSKKSNINLGMISNVNSTIITNAPDKSIFNSSGKKKPSDKIRIVISSWSSNINKGFLVYKWIDENLNFANYSVTFIGNSPIKFKNIKTKIIKDRIELSNELKKHDIFLTASKKDPCSNSLIEALHCNLPALALNDGGHVEIISNGGEFFSNNNEIIKMLKKIKKNYSYYQKKINVPDMDEVGEKYYDFISLMHKKQSEGKYLTKNFSYYQVMILNYHLILSKIKQLKANFIKKIINA